MTPDRKRQMHASVYAEGRRRKKRTCNGCFAMNLVGRRCSLGFHTKTVYDPNRPPFYEMMAPTDNCPKPRTRKAYILLLDAYERDRRRRR